jgi:hypothetical protein
MVKSNFFGSLNDDILPKTNNIDANYIYIYITK